MIPDLIYDLGMHDGSDTEFYLAKGFRVLAVEANPTLCAKAEERFADAIAAERLTVLNKGVAAEAGRFSFTINLDKDDWSSFAPSFAERAYSTEIVEVDCVPLNDLFAEHGVPYYLKVDIEGHDDHAIASLERGREYPKFVSTEATVGSFGDRMAALGYSQFKIISQLWHQHLSPPFPPLEGTHVPARFTGVMSGPFGDETYGPWLSLEDFKEEHRRCAHREFEGSLHQQLGCPPEIFQDSWFDFHARLG